MMCSMHIAAQRCLFVLLLSLLASQAWSASYTASAETFSWIDPAAHTNVMWTAAPGGPANECSGPSANTDDDISQDLVLGFSFPFGGTNYNSVRITSNGRIQFNNTFCGFGSSNSGTPRNYPYPMPDTRFNNVLRVYGADLDPSAGGTVRYASLGTAPNRSFVVTWSNVREWNSGSSNFNLQVILYETGQFVYQYGSIINPSQGQAQIGWQINNGDYQVYEYSSIIALQNSALRFSSYSPTAIAYYAMDALSWNGTANEVQDSSGNNHHGDRIGATQTIDPGYICRGAQFPGNNDGIDTKLNVNSGIGNRGTITFWYNSDAGWSSGNNMLVDASNNLGNPGADKNFYLVKRTQGRLRFQLEDSNDTDLAAETADNNFASGTWHHITVTWDLVTDADWLQIYVDGTRQVVNRGNLTNPLNVANTLGNLNTLYLGDNRDNGVNGTGYSNSSARGVMDETRIYTDVLSPAQITADMNQTHACLLGAWNMDESLWDSTANEVVDSSGNNRHGTSINGAMTSVSNPAIAGNPGTCGYGQFDGSNDYIALPGFPNLTESFTITAWINPTVINKDQRIFADDESNSGGYAFSLGDGGDGRLRFFSRNISPVSLDSTAVITAGTWYHVAAVHNVTSKTRQLFVNGVAVTSAQSYSGTWGSDNGTAAIGGETNGAGSEAVANWRFGGSIDETRVYGRALSGADITSVMNETRPCAVTYDHLRIEHDGSGLTCEPENITVRACLNASCSSEYTGNVTVTLTPSGWTGGDAKTISGGSGSFTLPRTTSGTITLGASATSPSPSNGIQCLNTANSTADCNLTFHNTGFIYSIPTQTSCTTSNNITMSAVRLDDTTQACVPTFVSQTRNITFSLNYAIPASGTKDLTLTYNASAYTPINNVTSQIVPVTFDSNGQANFTVTYPDAGQISLNSQYTGSAGTGDAGLVMSGTASFLNKPYKLLVFSDDGNADCASASSSCSAFTQAGNVFNLKIRGACSDDSVTPNFQLSNLSLTHQNVAPAISQGTMAVSNFDMLAADNGEHTITNQSVSEVGAFTFTAGLPVGGYFGETIGDASLNTSGIIGRFYPDHFCAGAAVLFNRTDPNSAAACTDTFSYLDEEFAINLPVTAQNFASGCGAGGLTVNYSGTWAKFNSPFNEDTTAPAEPGKWNFAAANNPTTTPLNLNARLGINGASSSGSFNNGQATINVVLNINRAGSAPLYNAETPLTNTHIGFNPVDTDNVRIDSTNLVIGGDNYRDIGTTALFFGRLYAENAFGSHQPDTPLDMFARTEYCSAISGNSCIQWLSKTDDSCSLYNINPPPGIELRENATSATPGYYLRASPTITSSVFDFTDDGAAPSYARVHFPDTSNHSAGWRLFYRAGGNGGDFVIPFRFPFNVDPAVHPYLLHVNGIASFGQFRGDDRIIYWREVLE